MADNKFKDAKTNLELKVSEEIALGQYANLAIVSHSQMEFILDFASILPGMPNPSVNSRIVMTPQHAKQLLKMLHENVERFETSFGQINMPRQDVQSQESQPQQTIYNAKLGNA